MSFLFFFLGMICIGLLSDPALYPLYAEYRDIFNSIICILFFLSMEFRAHKVEKRMQEKLEHLKTDISSIQSSLREEYEKI